MSGSFRGQRKWGKRAVELCLVRWNYPLLLVCKEYFSGVRSFINVVPLLLCYLWCHLLKLSPSCCVICQVIYWSCPPPAVLSFRSFIEVVPLLLCYLSGRLLKWSPSFCVIFLVIYWSVLPPAVLSFRSYIEVVPLLLCSLSGRPGRWSPHTRRKVKPGRFSRERETGKDWSWGNLQSVFLNLAHSLCPLPMLFQYFGDHNSIRTGGKVQVPS